MNNVNITVSLSEEDRARLDAIYQALQQVGANLVVTWPATSQAPVPAQDEPESEQEPPAQDTPTATHGMVQDLVISLTSRGYKAEAREIVQRYAPRVSAIADADLDAVFTALDAVRQAHEGED